MQQNHRMGLPGYFVVINFFMLLNPFFSKLLFLINLKLLGRIKLYVFPCESTMRILQVHDCNII